MNKEELEGVIEYINSNKVNSRSRTMGGAEYKTLKAAKIASYFKPYIAWYDNNIYMKGKCLIGFDKD